MKQFKNVGPNYVVDQSHYFCAANFCERFLKKVIWRTCLFRPNMWPPYSVAEKVFWQCLWKSAWFFAVKISFNFQILNKRRQRLWHKLLEALKNLFSCLTITTALLKVCIGFYTINQCQLFRTFFRENAGRWWPVHVSPSFDQLWKSSIFARGKLIWVGKSEDILSPFIKRFNWTWNIAQLSTFIAFRYSTLINTQLVQSLLWIQYQLILKRIVATCILQQRAFGIYWGITALILIIY